MKFFIFISLLSALLLGITISEGWQKTSPRSKKLPIVLENYRKKIAENFERPENAAILFSFISGDKSHISPYTKNAFKTVNLSFLLAPSGIHFSALLLILGFFLKRITSVKMKRFSYIFLLLTSFSFSTFESIKRLSLLRMFLQIKFFAKMKLSIEQVFILTFLASFLMGGFSLSPLSFIYSLLFLGTFFSLRNFSKLTLILGLFSTQLILGLFMGSRVSLLSIPVGLILSFLFSFIFPVLLLFLTTFWMIPFNWGEPVIRTFVLVIQYAAKLLNGSFTSSSVFLIAAIWCLMMLKYSKFKCAAIMLLIFLHTDTAMTPVQYPPNLPHQSQKA